MKKKLVSIITILVLILCAIFVVVKNKDNQQSNLNNPPSEIANTVNNNSSTNNDKKNDSSTDKIAHEDEGYVEMKKRDLPSWTDFKMSLKGQEFQLPMLYSDFEKLGYKIPDIRESDSFNPLQSASDILVTNEDGSKFHIIMENKDTLSASVYDCYVTGIQFTTEYQPSSYNLPVDLALNMSYDEIIEKLGEPVQKYQPNDESTAIWNINQKYSCTVHFNANNIATEISMNYNLD